MNKLYFYKHSCSDECSNSRQRKNLIIITLLIAVFISAVLMHIGANEAFADSSASGASGNSASAGNKKITGYVTIAVEKFTLGQGFLLAPKKMPIYDGDKVSDVTTRALDEADIKYKVSIKNKNKTSYYLAQIEDKNRGKVTFSKYIQSRINEMTPDERAMRITYEDSTPDYLGEFDYTNTSGWVYCQNGAQPPKGAGQATVHDGDVIVWQFTCLGLGVDTYASLKTDTNHRLDRTELYPLLADTRFIKDDADEIKSAYNNCMKYAEDLDSTPAEAENDINALKQWIGENKIYKVQLQQNAQTNFDTLSGLYIKYENDRTYLIQGYKKIPLPILRVRLDDKKQLINFTGFRWKCDNFDANKPGLYTFTPEIIGGYTLQPGVELPSITVNVFAQGDINRDGKIDDTDRSLLLSLLTGKEEDPASCPGRDINSDGSTDLADLAILLQALNPKESQTSYTGGHLILLFDKDTYEADETASAKIIAYGGNIDACGIALKINDGKNAGTESGPSGQISDAEISWRDDAVPIDTSPYSLCKNVLQGAVWWDNAAECTDSGVELGIVTLKMSAPGRPNIKFTLGIDGSMIDKESGAYSGSKKIEDYNLEINYPDDIATERTNQLDALNKAMPDSSLYYAKEWEYINAARDKAESQINTAVSRSMMKEAVSDFRVMVDKQKTKLDYWQENFRNSKFVLSKKTYYYTGKAIRPAVTGKHNGKTLKLNRDFTVQYKNNIKTGTAAVIIRGKGIYDGTKTLKFTIKKKPAKSSIRKIKSSQKKTVTLTWKKISKNCKGYQIRYSLKKNMKKSRTVTARNYKTSSKTIKKLKSKHKYYFQIRTYNTSDNKKVYSGWSNKKSIKVK